MAPTSRIDFTPAQTTTDAPSRRASPGPRTRPRSRAPRGARRRARRSRRRGCRRARPGGRWPPRWWRHAAARGEHRQVAHAALGHVVAGDRLERGVVEPDAGLPRDDRDRRRHRAGRAHLRLDLARDLEVARPRQPVADDRALERHDGPPAGHAPRPPRERSASRDERNSVRSGKSLPMRQRQLRDLTVSAIGLGCMGMSEFYGEPDDEQSVATIHRALDIGVTFLDTSDMYGSGHNEQLVGRGDRRAPRRGPARHQVRDPARGRRRAGSTTARSGSARPATAPCAGWASTGSTSTTCTAAIRTSRSRRASARWPSWSERGQGRGTSA